MVWDAMSECAIGLDIGGTKIAGGVVAASDGRILLRRITPTLPERGGQAVLDDAVALAHELKIEAEVKGWAVRAIGIGVCELVDPHGNVTSAHTVAWQGLPVQATFAHLAPATVESDARAPALAEAWYGAGRPYRLFVYVTVGTGISCCFVQDGRPYAGAKGNALILASSPLTTTCTHCGAVLKPILEEFASGPALVARYNAASSQYATRGEDVMAAVARGDSIASEVVRSAGEALGVSVGWLVNVLDPEAIVVGGGLGSIKGLYWDSFVKATREHIWSDTNRDLPILQAALGPDAGMIGAAATALQKLGAHG
jgi:predicted NBD/HSP70 family sugar kinase